MNSKGFGNQKPQLSQGDVARLNKICDAVLARDVDAPDRFVAFLNRVEAKMGKRAYRRWFVHDLNDNLGFEISGKFFEAMHSLLPPDIRQEMAAKSKECLTSIFRDDGLTLGKDFSMAPDGGFILGEKAIQKLKVDMPLEAWADWESQGLIKSVTSCPWASVEKRLDVPLRKNLLHRLSELVEQGRAAAVIAGWMMTISCGVSHQVMGSDEDLTLFNLMLRHLHENHEATAKKVWTALQSGNCANGDELLAMGINCLCDVAIAAGSSEQNAEIKGDHINRKCLQRLALVWRGDKFSMTEVIGLLDKHSRGKAA